MFADISRHDRSLREYQQRAKENIFSAWDECDNVMFQMPTGTGKTRLFTSIISDIKTWGVLHSIDERILIIAHRVELIEQISESLAKYKIQHGVIAGGVKRDLLQQVQVASIQTLMHPRNIEAVKELHINFIIIDEAHHSMANSYKKLWTIYEGSKKLGVTATPWRMNNSGFRSIYDKLILSQSIKKFIQQTWLSSYSYYSIKENSDVSKRIGSITEYDIEGDYKISALEREMDNVQIRAQLLETYLKYAKGKKGIIYSISRKHSDHICKEFREAGINIVRIDSETPRDERRLYVERFKKGLIDIIVNVDIFSEGFDCPDIEFIQLARPTKSLVKYLQQVGRGLRPTEGKTNCIILDNVGVHHTFGLPNADHDWEKHFVGGEPSATSAPTGRTRNVADKGDLKFSEGTDELELIDDSGNETNAFFVSKEEHITWSSKDDELLKQLVLERHCTPEILSMVFGKTIGDINDRITSLNISHEP